jgi:hypothetical protein
MIEINNVGMMALQIVIGLIIIMIVYLVVLNTMDFDSIVTVPDLLAKQRDEITIVKGIAKASELKRRYNTVFPFRMNYVPFMKMTDSVNGRAGRQFTYQFWMKIQDTNVEAFKDLVVLLKGDNRKYQIGYYDYENPTHPLMKEYTTDPDYMIKCPLIRFKGSHRNLVVEFNTSYRPNEEVQINLATNAEAERINPLSMLALDWSLLTFVFQEDPNRGGIKFTFYVNDKAVLSPTFNGFLKSNDGDLYLFPNLDTTKNVMDIADLKYCNFAKTDAEVRYDFSKGRKYFSGNSRPTSIYTEY